MKIIERDYLKELIDVIGTPDIKVITGVRRSGKSKLLNMFKNYIENNIKDANIININFNLIKFDYLRNYITLNNYIEEHFINGKNNFVLIDEVQMCKEFIISFGLAFLIIPIIEIIKFFQKKRYTRIDFKAF